MKYLIGVFDESKLNLGKASWTGKSFDDIKSFFNDKLSADFKYGKGIAYFSTSANNSKNAFEIKIQSLNYLADSLTVHYTITGILDIPSIEIKNKAQRILRGQKVLPNDKFIPYFSILDEHQFQRLLQPKTITEEIKLLTEKNDWHGILQRFGDLDDIRKFPEVWEDEYVLNGISFATAKLSETYVNLRHQFRNDDDKLKFLKQQKHYRELTETLRLRCIELNPMNPTFYSNLGYSHYQYTRELTMLGGRRDGSAKVEAEESLKYLNKALELNPERITDNYRKGQLLTEIIPKLLLFSRKSLVNKELIEDVNSKIKEGINAFEAAIRSYESIPDSDYQKKQRLFKDYIKCNYDVARSYADLISCDWDELVYLLSLDKDIDSGDRTTFIPEDLENTEKAIKFALVAIQSDSPQSTSTNDIQAIIDTASYNGVIEGVFKLYSLGKYHFQKYWVVSGYGQKSNLSADYARSCAERLLQAALKFPWSDEKEKSNKSYIAERLCRLYITKKDYDKAIDILQPFIKQNSDYYIRYSLAEALILAGRFEEAHHQIKQALIDEKGNKEIWLGIFLDSIALMRSGKFPESKIELEKAITAASKERKKNIDTLLIAQGYISIKEGNRQEAIDFFKRALEINPYRVAIQKRVPGWRNLNN